MSTFVLASIMLSFPGGFTNDPPASPEQVVLAAEHLGLSAESLAAAGIYGSEVGEVLDRLLEEYGSFQSYTGHLEDTEAAHRSVAELRAACRLDPTDEEAATDLASALSTAASAESQARSERGSLLEVLCEDLATGPCTLAIFVSEHAQRLCVPAYRHAIADAEDAAQLCWAVRMSGRFEGSPSDLPAGVDAIMSSAESNVSVQTAAVWMASNSVANQAAIDTWTNQSP